MNVHVLENIGPFDGCPGGVRLFELGLFYAEISSATESPVGMYRTSIESESCLSAEEVYLLNKRTSIETASFVSLRGTVVVGLRAFL